MTTYKKPTEIIPFGVDFTSVLPENETLQNTSSITITDPDGVDVTGTMLDETDIASPLLRAKVTGGEDLKDYIVTFHAVTQNYLYEEDVTVKVRN